MNLCKLSYWFKVQAFQPGRDSLDQPSEFSRCFSGGFMSHQCALSIYGPVQASLYCDSQRDFINSWLCEL